jgi:hypothetical protein
MCLAGMNGCGRLRYRINTPVPEQFVPNPVELPAVEDQFLWLQVVDVVDDYFRIQSEQPVQSGSSVVLEGRLETAYRIGASLLEPWRKDSTAGFERLQSTLQSIRRRATVIVRPRGNRYLVEVIVVKELEDTDRSQDSTEGVAPLQHAGTVYRDPSQETTAPKTLGWIPLGRDATLEQVILQDIVGRVTQPDTQRLLHR